jgi:protein-tyrosine-phosphatase
MAGPIRVLFVCTGNSARSQMAEALLARLGGDDFLVASAGTEPRGVNPYTIRVLHEVGIDWSGATSTSLERFLDEPFDHVVTVCDRARQACPEFRAVAADSPGISRTRPRSKGPTPSAWPPSGRPVTGAGTGVALRPQARASAVRCRARTGRSVAPDSCHGIPRAPAVR